MTMATAFHAAGELDVTNGTRCGKQVCAATA